MLFQRLIFTFLIISISLLPCLNTTSLAAERLPAIIITEINNSPTSDLEWIEIWNNSNQDLSVNDLRLIENETRHQITHPTLTTIAPQQIIIIANQAESIVQQLQNDVQVFDSSWGSLSLEGELLAIEYKDINYDQINYPSSTTNSTSELTLQRVSLDQFQLATPSPFNHQFDSEPKAASSPPSISPLILISEVSPNSDNDFIELYIDPLSSDLNLENWQLASNKTLYTFNEQIISSPQLLTINEQEGLNSGLTKTNNNLKLLNPNGEIIDALCWHNDTPPSSKARTLKTWQEQSIWNSKCLDSTKILPEASIGRLHQFDHNNATDWHHFPHPSPNTPNQHINQPPQAKITIQSGQTTSTKNLDINLTAAESSDPDNDQLSYTWFLNDQLWIEKANPNKLSLTEIGTHKIKLVVIDTSNASSSALLYLEVKPEPEPKQPPSISSSPKCPQPDLNSQPTTSPDLTSAITPQPISQSQAVTTANWDQIKITSFLANPTGTDNNQEWIELTNTSDHELNLMNWQLDDIDGGSKPFTITNLSIPAQHSITLTNQTTKINLNNNGDSIRLIDPYGQIRDQYTYTQVAEAEVVQIGNTSPTTVPVKTNSASTQLKPQQTQLINHPSSAQTTSTSKYQNGTLTNQVIISEVFPNPSGQDKNNEWLEFHNQSSQTINLGNWQIIAKNKNYTLPDTINIPANSYYQLNPNTIKLTLANKDTQLQLVDWQQQTIATVTYNNSKDDQAYSYFNDQWQWTNYPTPGQPNPKLITISGQTNSQLLNQNQLIVETNSGSRTIEFSSNQINSSQLALLNQPSQIKLSALAINSRLILSQIIQISQEQKTATTKPIALIPIIILLLTTITIISYKPTRHWLTTKAKLAINSQSH